MQVLSKKQNLVCVCVCVCVCLTPSLSLSLSLSLSSLSLCLSLSLSLSLFLFLCLSVCFSVSLPVSPPPPPPPPLVEAVPCVEEAGSEARATGAAPCGRCGAQTCPRRMRPQTESRGRHPAVPRRAAAIDMGESAALRRIMPIKGVMARRRNGLCT